MSKAPVSTNLESRPLWSQGWYSPARKMESPNYGDRPSNMAVDMLVLHSISLPPGQFGGGYIQALFTNRLDWNQHPYFQSIQGVQVSSHFLIARDAVLWQFVSCDQRAWHAGASSFQGRSNCNDFSIGVELEGLEGESFEPAQYTALVGLCLVLKQHYPLDFVVGHEHIAPGRKQDPGVGFDWISLQRGLQWKSDCFPFFGK